MNGRDRSRVVDNARKVVRQMEPLTKPIEHECFQFGCGRRGPPGHGIDVERARNHFCKDSRTCCRATKVAHELWMRPVRNSWNNHAFDIREDFIEGRSCFWRSCVQLRQNCSRFIVWSNALLTDIFAIISNQISETMNFLAKNLCKKDAYITHTHTQMCTSSF